MNEMTCNQCGRIITDGSIFCPDCGAAIFRDTPAAPSTPPPPESVPEEIPAEIPQKKPDYKKLIAPAAAVLAVVLLLIFGWDTLMGVFGPKYDPTLSTSPSTEATVPSTQPPTQKPTPPPTETEPPPPETTQPPTKDPYSSYYELGSDGIHRYLANGYDTPTEIIRTDMLTGSATVIVQHGRILATQLDAGGSLYYAVAEDSQLEIYRVELSTLSTELIYEFEIHPLMPATWFSINVNSAKGIISWQGISPEMLDALYAEFSNPDSIYYPNFGDHYYEWREYWEDPELLRELPYSLHGSAPMMKLQEDKNLQALWKGTYNTADGVTTLDWGIVDSCWFGSGLLHDHWNPELTEEIPPTILDAETIPIPEMVPPSAEMIENIRQEEDYNSGNEPYEVADILNDNQPILMYQDGAFQPRTDLPYAKKGIYLVNTKYYTYYASADNTLIRLDLNGNASVIYTAKHGELDELCYRAGELCFVDGNTIVLLDTVACTSRELLTHPGHFSMYYDSPNQKLYMVIWLGMATDSYIFDPATGEIEETRYRL